MVNPFCWLAGWLGLMLCLCLSRSRTWSTKCAPWCRTNKMPASPHRDRRKAGGIDVKKRSTPKNERLEHERHRALKGRHDFFWESRLSLSFLGRCWSPCQLAWFDVTWLWGGKGRVKACVWWRDSGGLLEPFQPLGRARISKDHTLVRPPFFHITVIMNVHISTYIYNNLFVKTSLPSLSLSPVLYLVFLHFIDIFYLRILCIPVIHATMCYDHIAYDLSCYTYVLCILCGIDFLNLWSLDETHGVGVLNPSMVMGCSSIGAKIHLWYAWRFNVKTGLAWDFSATSLV